MFDSLEGEITVFEIAPNSSNGETFWIYEIDQPGTFFADCETDDEALTRLIDSDRSPDEIIETCGYTLVLNSPEDPHSSDSSDIPDGPVVFEVINGDPQERVYEFYEVDSPQEVFANSWGDTIEMFESISAKGIEPIQAYDNVELKFQRPYGAL